MRGGYDVNVKDLCKVFEKDKDLYLRIPYLELALEDSKDLKKKKKNSFDIKF